MAGWDDARRRIEHFRHWPSVTLRDDRSILIAGCGTSQAARWAARYPAARVMGIDVSPASLEAEQRLIERHQIENLELRELPIERVGTLGRSFDQIVCTGVLHHLADPPDGLRALREVLTPDGALQLMVYARYGRFGITMIQDYVRRLGLEATPEDIDSLIAVLRELPLGHPLSHLLRNTPDFTNRDALADALLNPREQTYTVPELFDLLEVGGLRFARWVRQAPYRPQVGIMGDLAHREPMASMDEVGQFAAMELFRGTIVRHSLIAYTAESTLPRTPVHWTGDDWRAYVAMVPPTVVVVEDRLPSGMAAAVINRAHIDRDLVCFLDAEELTVFRAIDADTPLTDVAGATPRLFERLWMHDLVMIDATGDLV